MRKKQLPILIISMLMLFAIIGLVSSLTTLNVPAANSIISGSITFNVTTDDVTNGRDNATFTFYAISTLTANSSWVTIGVNASINMSTLGNHSATVINLLNRIEDSNEYIFNVTMTNATDGAWLAEDTSIGVTVDHTLPVPPTALSPATASVDGDGSITFSGTVVGVNVTSCTLRFIGTNFGGVSQAMTHTGDTCSLTLNNVPDQTYQWFIRASDETNTSDSSTFTVTSDIQTGGGIDPSGGGPTGLGGFGTLVIVIIGGFVLWKFFIKK